MIQPGRRSWILFLAAVLLPLAITAPCAARGTGGFLREWAVCGPLAGTLLDAPALPPDFTIYPGLAATAYGGCFWLPVQAEPEGCVNLGALFPEAPAGTALLHTFFEIPADGTYHLRIGSDDAVRIEIDGGIVHASDVRRTWEADQDAVNVPLTQGWHRMLVRVVNYGGGWGVSVRLADEKDQPLDVKHQASVPEPLRAACRLDEPVPADEQAAVGALLKTRIADLLGALEAAKPRLAEMPEGYVTFAEYESARNRGLRFLEALTALWQEALRQPPSAETLPTEQAGAAQAKDAAAGAARGFSETLAQETDRLGSALAKACAAIETLTVQPLTRGELAAAALPVADLVAQSRRLAAAVENEGVLAARLENDIRNNRQRDLTVLVRDADGRPVAADVEITQTAHDFLFGCNLFAFRRWGDETKNRLYEERFRNLFTLAVVPTYWSAVEKQCGQPDFGPLDDAVRWCRENHIQVKGHPLLWQETIPRWAEELPPEAIRPAVADYVRRLIQRYRESVDWWDIVYQPAPGTAIGEVTIQPVEVARWAEVAQPKGRILLSHDDPQALVLAANQIREWEGRLDGVALSAHQHSGTWPTDLVRQTLDAAAAAGLPVHISGITILGDETAQAEAVRQFYTAAFAHPAVVSITWWDLSDQFAWKNTPAGLLRADLSPKPAYEILDRLINHLWRTEAKRRTGDDGKVSVRGFLGTYRITARLGDLPDAAGRTATAEVHLGREGPNEFEITLPEAK